MNPSSLEQIIQYTAWFLALIELVSGLYILILNSWHPANRHAGASLLLISLNTGAIGWAISARTFDHTWLPVLLLASTSLAITPMLFMTTIVLFKPEWRRNRWRSVWWFVYALVFLPGFLIFSDFWLGTKLHFPGFSTADNIGGFPSYSEVAGGALSSPLRFVSFIILPVLTISILFYITLFDKKTSTHNKRLAWYLLAAGVIVGFGSLLFAPLIYPAVGILIANTVLAITYSFASLKQMRSERRLLRGGLQNRLTAVILAAAVPVFLAAIALIFSKADEIYKQSVNTNLIATNHTIANSVNYWLDINRRALNELVTDPDVISMQTVRQKPVLEMMESKYPHLSLITISGLDGINITRNDGADLEDVSGRDWYQNALGGTPLTMSIQIGQSRGGPVLVSSTPVRDQTGEITGVGMIASELATIADQVLVHMPGGRGIAVVIDQDNQIIAHSARRFTSVVQDLGDYPPVVALREEIASSEDFGQEWRSLANTTLSFTNIDGQIWQAYGQELENGWIVLAQIPQTGLLGEATTEQRISGIALLLGVILIFILFTTFAIRQSIHPIKSLTEAASGISGGDLTLVAPIESDDELGKLARTFNSMTSQLRDLITNLERRVADRAQDMEKRAVQLQVAAEVAREAATIHQLDELLEHSVDLISQRFDFYHAGLFLIDDAGQYAVLRAASSEGGKNMLAKGHKLAVGLQGIVGYVAGQGEPRIALDVGADAVYFDNPDLPLTRSELSLPLVVRGSITGVLDVQSIKAQAFNEDDLSVLQTLADQIALAIDNTRLFSESQQSLKELEQLYKGQVDESWADQLADKTIAYTYDRLSLVPISVPPEEIEDSHRLRLKLSLRGQTFGTIYLRRELDQNPWSADEVQMAESCLTQLSLALENARLVADIRNRARDEHIVGQITANAQKSLDLDTVMKKAVQDIGQALGAAKVQIRLGNGKRESISDYPPVPRN